MSRTERAPLAMEHALLGFLRRKPMHGYEIYQRVTEATGLWLVWRMKQSQLYALLARLENEGYISATIHQQDSRPPRKMLRLTRAGRERFDHWLRSPVPHGRELRQDFLGKFYFALQEDPAVAAELIARQREACHTWRTDMRKLKANEEEARAGGEQPSFVALVRDFRIGQISAMLEWLDSCERMLTPIHGSV